jgi:hypothetical protein
MMPGVIALVRARAVKWASDEPFPGMIEVELADASGKVWRFVDKYPMFDLERTFGPSTPYPVALQIACTVVERRNGEAVISTAKPWGLESIDGTHEFLVNLADVSEAST